MDPSLRSQSWPKLFYILLLANILVGLNSLILILLTYGRIRTLQRI